MLRSMKDLFGYRIDATDGEIGKVKDLYFDARHWIVRYLVVDTGQWLPGRKVLISPASVRTPDGYSRTVPSTLKTQQIEMAPSVDSERPVSRQHEEQLAGFFGWPMYWTPEAIPAAGMQAPAVLPSEPQPPQADRQPQAASEDASAEDDSSTRKNLRSVDEVTGYRIQAVDGLIGHVEDFVGETDDWRLRYLVVDTRDLLPGRKVLMAIDWADDVSWTDRIVTMNLPREKIREAPEFDPSEPINREYESRLYDYFGMPRYWE